MNELLEKAKWQIFSPMGRLLDRQLYRFVFEDAKPEQLISAIAAYQNPDGGFGNGIEPDLQTPESSGIGLETALHYFDLVGRIPEEVQGAVITWLKNNLLEDGTLGHPPGSIDSYPHQPWWKNEDPDRSLAIVGLLHRLEIPVPNDIERIMARRATTISIQPDLNEYDYPVYLYAREVNSFERRDEFLSHLRESIVPMNDANLSHHLLVGRYWSFFHDLIDPRLLDAEAERFIGSLNQNGMLENVFADLPWWDPIITLDGLVALRSLGRL